MSTAEEAQTLLNKALQMAHLDPSQAEKILGQLIGLFEHADDPAVRKVVTTALAQRCDLLRQLGQLPEYHRQVAGLLSQLDGMTVDEVGIVAAVWANHVAVLSDYGRHDEAVEAADAAVGRLAVFSEPQVVEQIAWALYNKALALSHLDRFELALQVHEDIAGLCDRAMGEQLASSLLAKGVVLERLSRPGDAVAAYRELAVRFGRTTDPVIRELVARGKFNKGAACEHVGGVDAAIAAYDDVIVTFGDAAEVSVREHVAGAMINKAIRLEDTHAALQAWDRALDFLRDATEPQFRWLTVTAMGNKAAVLGGLHLFDDEIAVYDQLIDMFGDDTEQAMVQQVAKVVHNREMVRRQRRLQPRRRSARLWRRLTGRGSAPQPREDASTGDPVLDCYAELGIPPSLIADDEVQALMTAAAMTVLSDGFIRLEHEPLDTAELRAIFGTTKYTDGRFAQRLLQMRSRPQLQPVFELVQRDWGAVLGAMLVSPEARSWTAGAQPRTRIRDNAVGFGHEWSHRFDRPIEHVMEVEPGVPGIFALQDLVALQSRRTQNPQSTYWTFSRHQFVAACLYAYLRAYTQELGIEAFGEELIETMTVANFHGDPVVRLSELVSRQADNGLPHGQRDLVLWTDPRTLHTDLPTAAAIVRHSHALLRSQGGLLFAAPLAVDGQRGSTAEILKVIVEVFEISPTSGRDQAVHLDLNTGWTSILAVKR